MSREIDDLIDHKVSDGVHLDVPGEGSVSRGIGQSENYFRTESPEGSVSRTAFHSETKEPAYHSHTPPKD
jgi:hypothetical protein